MAVDETLLEGVRDGRPVSVRFYGWSPPCLSFGRNQPARAVFDAALAASRGIDIVRRPTGGQAVFHHLEVTYAVAVPVGTLGGPRETYAEINRALVEGLRGLGVVAAVSLGAMVTAAEQGGGRGAVVLSLDSCFQQAAAGEVVVGGQKLVGSAQRCDRRIILQHGSILIDGDQAPVLELQGLPSFGAEGATTLRALLGAAPDRATVEDALAAGFERYFGIRLAPAPLAPMEQERARQLALRYRSNAWTWRR
jgi:lipoate-protein ligase A